MTWKRPEHEWQFTILNQVLWSLIKSSVKDEKAYKKVMSELFKWYMNEDTTADRFSQEWWDKQVNYSSKDMYKDLGLEEFAAEMMMAFLNYWEYLSKGNKESQAKFFTYLNVPFVSELGRIENE